MFYSLLLPVNDFMQLVFDGNTDMPGHLLYNSAHCVCDLGLWAWPSSDLVLSTSFRLSGSLLLWQIRFRDCVQGRLYVWRWTRQRGTTFRVTSCLSSGREGLRVRLMAKGSSLSGGFQQACLVKGSITRQLRTLELLTTAFSSGLFLISSIFSWLLNSPL
jgi:hypothetical protein